MSATVCDWHPALQIIVDLHRTHDIGMDPATRATLSGRRAFLPVRGVREISLFVVNGHLCVQVPFLSDSPNMLHH